MNDLSGVVEQILAIPLREGRRVIAVIGAPASGKSTLADALAEQLPKACVIPMDGFHRSNDDLDRQGLLSRKGAPETFDIAGFIEIVRSLRTSDEVPFPTFDRANDCVVPAGGRVTAADQTIIVEGNYLLLDIPPWDELAKEWDFSFMIEVPLPVLQDRLIQRWLEHGYDEAGALARAESNDVPNAILVMNKSLAAGKIIVTP